MRNVSARCWWLALLFCTVYDSYRYPLQTNSAGTSPTYSDTPALFQLGKFVGVLLLCLASASFILSKRLKKNKWLIAGLLGYLALFPILKGVLSDRDSAVSYLEVAFWPLAALVLSLAAGSISVGSVDRYFRFVFYYALLSNAIEVMLFLLVGRLPALAYRGSISVRFGGFLDDPNGFPALLYMLMGWAYYKCSGWRCVLAEAALVLCLLLSQSLTALLYLAVLAILFVGYQIVRGPRRVLSLTICMIVGLIAIPFVPRVLEVVSTLIELKSSSIDVHLSQASIPLASTTLDWFLGSESYLPYETWWIGSIHNFGLVWYVLNATGVLIVISHTAAAFLRASKSVEKAVLAGILMLSLYFLVGNTNLPLFTVFPVNFIFFALSYVTLFGRIRETVAQPANAMGSLRRDNSAGNVSVSEGSA